MPVQLLSTVFNCVNCVNGVNGLQRFQPFSTGSDVSAVSAAFAVSAVLCCFSCVDRVRGCCWLRRLPLMLWMAWILNGGTILTIEAWLLLTDSAVAPQILVVKAAPTVVHCLEEVTVVSVWMRMNWYTGLHCIIHEDLHAVLNASIRYRIQ